MPKHAHLTKPLDLSAPGAIDQLLAFHKQHFGDARMEDEGADAGSGGDGADAGADGDQGAGDAGSTKDADQGAGKDGEGKLEDQPEWVQKLVREARADAGKARTTAKQQAAAEAKAELAQTIGKALGIVKDDKEQVDPTKLAEQVSAAQAAQRESAAELVVWRNAGDLKVDAQAVTDSRAFARAIADFDPSSKTFEADVKKAAQEAAEQNPKLKAARAAGKSSAEHAGGSGEGNAKPSTLEEAIAQKMAG